MAVVYQIQWCFTDHWNLFEYVQFILGRDENGELYYAEPDEFYSGNNSWIWIIFMQRNLHFNFVLELCLYKRILCVYMCVC